MGCHDWKLSAILQMILDPNAVKSAHQNKVIKSQHKHWRPTENNIVEQLEEDIGVPSVNRSYRGKKAKIRRRDNLGMFQKNALFVAGKSNSYKSHIQIYFYFLYIE